MIPQDAAMLMLVLSTLLIGAVLGRRFKVFVLIPTIGLAFIAIAAAAAARGDSAFAFLITAALASGCLQVGYLCGALTRHSNIFAAEQKTAFHPESAR
jgi:hypothetical protein